MKAIGLLGGIDDGVHLDGAQLLEVILTYFVISISILNKFTRGALTCFVSKETRPCYTDFLWHNFKQVNIYLRKTCNLVELDKI